MKEPGSSEPEGTKVTDGHDPVRLEDHNRAWADEIDSHCDDVVEFLKYFDDAGSAEEAWTRGYWDFAYHILKPRLLPLLGEPFQKVVLEIGYGGGRLLQAACRFFHKAVGVDVHRNQDMVGALLESLGISNFELHQTDGVSFPLRDQSIDFAYSFIVLQHLPTIEALRINLVELHRVMRPEAVGILYFSHLPTGFLRRHRFTDTSNTLFKHTRDVTLRLTMPCAHRMLRNAGFDVLKMAPSRKAPWRLDHGGQFYAMLQRC